MQFTTQNANEVVVKARGRFISRAVDVVEVATKRFLNGQIGVAQDGIKIGSEEFENKEGKQVRISFAEIKLIKKELL
jgi:archaea-specific DNA-binding protein